MKLQCLIIDDEQLAREMLEAYAKRIPDLEVVGRCKSATEAADFLNQYRVDFLLLDIQMPKLTGIDLLRQLTHPPKVILTTAYADYALEGYELEVVDYLLKPIGFGRFAKAISKVKELLATEQKAEAFEHQQAFDKQFLHIKEGYDRHKIFLKDIHYIEAMREYVLYHTTSGSRMELRSLTKLEKELPTDHFTRIHRSYIVANALVRGRERNIILLNDNIRLPIGKTYKKQVLMRLSKLLS